MNDTREIAATPDQVWAAILDAEILRQCVPGCQKMSGSPEEGFDATVVQKVGPVKATFSGKVILSEMDAPKSLKLSGEGKGGAAGFAKGEALVTLAPSGGGTLLTYEVDAKVGGKLAQMGSRIIDGFAKKMADQFFANFQEVVEGEGAEAAPVRETVAEAVAEAVAETVTPDAPKKGFLKRLFS